MGKTTLVEYLATRYGFQPVYEPFEDNPYLDAASNGLTYVAHAMRDETDAGHCLLKRSERSTLASVAADVL